MGLKDLFDIPNSILNFRSTSKKMQSDDDDRRIKILELLSTFQNKADTAYKVMGLQDSELMNDAGKEYLKESQWIKDSLEKLILNKPFSKEEESILTKFVNSTYGYEEYAKVYALAKWGGNASETRLYELGNEKDNALRNIQEDYSKVNKLIESLRDKYKNL